MANLSKRARNIRKSQIIELDRLTKLEAQKIISVKSGQSLLVFQSLDLSIGKDRTIRL
jgi:hypothetical protein